MLLAEPHPTPYDLHFSLFGFPVRITPWFWLVAVMLGGGAMTGGSLLIWVLVVLISILVHELGHAFAFQYFGTPSHIVLYHFGGLAIPRAFDSVWAARARDPREQALISAAGPLTQIASAYFVAAATRFAGFEVPVGGIAGAMMPFRGGSPMPSEAAYFMVMFYITVSVYWALLNLMPIYPLDGGQIARSLFLLYGGADAVRQSLVLSVCTGIGLAVFGFSTGSIFLGILFASLAYSSYQMLSQYGGGGYGGGPW